MARALNAYRLPIPEDAIIQINRYDSPAHVSKLKNAIDLVAPLGTPVLAAADGIVTLVRDDSDSGGPTIDYWQDTNFVAISHKNSEFTRYDHLQQWSSKVAVGQQVRAGDQIAKVGMTGFTYLPHLHFQVFVFTGFNIWSDYETLSIQDFQRDD